MRVVVVGLGTQGNKRLAVAQGDAVATVDPVNPKAQHKSIQNVPLDSYDAALLCVPDKEKLALLEYLLSHGKHVLVEKPLLGDPETIKKLAQLAASRRAACYTAYNHRFEPFIVKLKELLDGERIGEVYFARFFYGNGTARDVRQSAWRDEGLGVVSDLGSHLLDMALFLFGKREYRFKPWTLNAFENRAYDHAVFASNQKPLIELEMTMLSWRNTFTADIFGENGSLHMDCLCKWGPSTLRVRKRVLPSGRPDELVESIEMPDPTWAKEYEHFKKMCASGQNNLENDVWIQSVLNGLTVEAGVMRP